MKIIEITVGTRDDNQQESHQGLGRRAAWVSCEESDPEAFPGNSGARLRWNVLRLMSEPVPRLRLGGRLGRQAQPSPMSSG